MTEHSSVDSDWRQRMAALRNVPPVLKIVWQSGPAVVALGLIFRLVASLLPLALLWITKLIIDGVVHTVSTHQPVSQKFWELVAAEFALALFSSVLARGIDFLDLLLAERYTRHVSIQVMKHAAELDVIAYEIRFSMTAWSGRECRRRTA